MEMKLTPVDVGYEAYIQLDHLGTDYYHSVSEGMQNNVRLAVKVVNKCGIETFRCAYLRAMNAEAAKLSKNISVECRESVVNFCVTMHAIFLAVEKLAAQSEQSPYKLDASHKRFTWPK